MTAPGPMTIGELSRRTETPVKALREYADRGLIEACTPWYAPPLGFTNDAVLIFYGASMLLAALRGYPGCEVLAVSNWLLRRDDQVGCVIFPPLDCLERRLTGRCVS
jgi:hypothetical protein